MLTTLGSSVLAWRHCAHRVCDCLHYWVQVATYPGLLQGAMAIASEPSIYDTFKYCSLAPRVVS